MGFEAQIDAKHGAFAGSSATAVFSIRDPSSDTLMISQLLFEALSPQMVNVERLVSRPVALRDIHIRGGLPFRGTSGPLFLADVEGGEGWQFTAGQQVWARQLNAEQTGTKIRNDGADLWILGLKTEVPGTAIQSTAGARTELLGGLLYPAGMITDGMPAFSSSDAIQSLTVATSAYDQARNYKVLVSATRDGVNEQLTSADVQHRGFGSMITLYSGTP